MEKEKLKTAKNQEPVFDETRYKKNAVLSFSLFFIFALVYFFAAILTTIEFGDIAAISIGGLPLAVYLGVFVMVVGVVITRFYLIKKE